MTISSILADLIINAASSAPARKLIFVSIDMETAAHANDVYRPRNPHTSDYFKCAQAHFEELEMLWDDRYQQRYGFRVSPAPNPKDLEDLFRYEVFKMLKAEGKITDAVIENMMNWHHSGFNVYCGEAIWPHNEEGLENLARYIIRASFSQERMTYIPADESSDRFLLLMII